MATSDYQVTGKVAAAPFTLKVHRGEGMCLLAMNWRGGRPPDDFAGFAMEYCEPGDVKFWAVSNRLAFPGLDGKLNPTTLSSRVSPIQKFRWVHFPYNADKPGKFTYRVTPVFMSASGALSYGLAQEVQIALARETVAGEINVAFTRGLISSQAFVDRYAKTNAAMATLLPAKAEDGLAFVPTHADAKAAYDWMGFEARRSVIELLDAAVADPTAQVRVVAYDLNIPEMVQRLVALGPRLKVIIDDSDKHGLANSGETGSAQMLAASAGSANVKRQHMGSLQHNKFIVVDGTVNQAICGSTNFSWRGFFVQANNAVTLTGATAVKRFQDAFDGYWASNAPADFGALPAANWRDLGLAGVDAQVAFSPHSAGNALLQSIADDIGTKTTSSLFYSLAFLYQTDGPVRKAIEKVTAMNDRFVYGMSEHKVSGLDVQKPNGNVAAVYPSALTKNLPPPFKPEPTGGKGIRMHHKFVVIDFDKPTARVYLGSYNFSGPADRQNGENLLRITDRRVVTAYAVEAIGLFDHYHFRVAQNAEKKKTGTVKSLTLKVPPKAPGDLPWFDEDYTVPYKIRDRELFS